MSGAHAIGGFMAGLALWSALLAIKDGRFADRILAGANLTIAIWLMQQ